MEATEKLEVRGLSERESSQLRVPFNPPSRALTSTFRAIAFYLPRPPFHIQSIGCTFGNKQQLGAKGYCAVLVGRHGELMERSRAALVQVSCLPACHT